MIDVDDICTLYRRAHNDRHIISIICMVHCLHKKQVLDILMEKKLMTAEGKYNAPIRLTGRENSMPQWKWMPHRKEKFDQMKAEGKSMEEIAKELGCTLEIVTEYDRNPRPIKPHKKPMAPKQTASASAPPETTSVSKDKICGLAEQLLAMELLEYHNKNYLSGDNKSRSKVRQALLRELVSLCHP